MAERTSGPHPVRPTRHTGPLSAVTEVGIVAFGRPLRDVEDLSAGALRADRGDLRAFAFWCEVQWPAGPSDLRFTPDQLTTPLLTRSRTHLQAELNLRPARVNRALAALKRFCRWAEQVGLAPGDPARVVRLVRLEAASPRGLTDQEEALVRTVQKHGPLRDRTLVILMLHTGLRASEVCALRQRGLTLGPRSGSLTVTGKGHKVRDVPLNASARETLTHDLPSLPPGATFLFPSDRRDACLSTRALDRLIRKYALLAELNLSPHDLRHRLGSVMTEQVPLHRLAQIMGHNSLDITARSTRAAPRDLQAEVENIAWR
jgi:integrase/recombinase XerD